MKKSRWFHTVSFLLVAEDESPQPGQLMAGTLRSNCWLLLLEGIWCVFADSAPFSQHGEFIFPNTHSHFSRTSSSSFLLRNLCSIPAGNCPSLCLPLFPCVSQGNVSPVTVTIQKGQKLSIQGGRKGRHLEVRFKVLKNPQPQSGSLRKDTRRPADSLPWH